MDSKKQNSVQNSTFGSEFCTLKHAVELIEALCYKLRVFGIPVESPSNVYCDNEADYKNASTPNSVLNKKHHSARGIWLDSGNLHMLFIFIFEVLISLLCDNIFTYFVLH